MAFDVEYRFESMIWIFKFSSFQQNTQVNEWSVSLNLAIISSIKFDATVL